MGAFCVFSISKSMCLSMAAKRTPEFEPLAGGKRRFFSIIEWAAMRDEMAAKLFAELEKPQRISPEFDAPQFCTDWIAAAPNEVRLTSIMVRGPKIDKSGKVVVRKGQTQLTWLPYEGPSQAAKFAELLAGSAA